MKKFIPLILIFFALGFGPAHTWWFAGGDTPDGGGPASCTTDNDAEQWSPVGQDGGNTSNHQLICDKVTTSQVLDITSYLIRICDNNSDTGNAEVSLYNHDAGNDQPDETSQVANSAKDENASSFPDCVSYAETSVELAATLEDLAVGTYWLCVEEEASADFKVRKDGTSTGDRWCYSDDGGSSWTCQDNQSQDLEVWGCTN